MTILNIGDQLQSSAYFLDSLHTLPCAQTFFLSSNCVDSGQNVRSTSNCVLQK